MPTTIVDVAKACKLSPSTISLVMSDHPRIPPSTKEKVRKKIRELNYKPNRIARSLVNGKTHIIAVLIPPIENIFSDPFFVQALEGIHSITAKSDYKIILEVTVPKFWKEKKYLDICNDSLIDALIVLGGRIIEHKKLVEVKNICPCVIVGSETKKLSSVSGDNFTGGYVAAKHLIDSGHTKIAHIYGDQGVLSARSRFKGFKKALKDAGITLNKNWLEEGKFTEWGGYIAAKKILSGKDIPSAIFAGNDLMAFGVIRAANEFGFKVPDDLSVVGMDDIPDAGKFIPALTTVRYPIFAMGAYAADSIIKQIENKTSLKVFHKVMDVTLIKRESTKNLGGDYV